MAFLFSQYVLYYSKILHKFGIIKMPDIDPETGMSEEEAYLKAVSEREEKERKLNETINRIDAITGNEQNIQQFKEFKTINDYYREIDEEKARYYENSNNTRVNFEREIGIEKNNSNRIDLLNHYKGQDPFSNGSNTFGNDLVGSILGDDF